MSLVYTRQPDVNPCTMKIILLLLIGFSCRSINARLIEKVTDRTLTTETKTTGSSPPVRLTRDVYDDSITGSSKESNVVSDEQVRPSSRKTKPYFRSKAKMDEQTTLIRVPRDSHEKVDKSKKNTSTAGLAAVHEKTTLVKKPIPKYNDMDYDEDFQMKISRSPMGLADSSEHEDEDFSVDDYDFDVNHDEFVGRGKPLEPRQKHKEQSAPKPAKQRTPHSEVSKNSAPQRPASNKKERAAQYPGSRKTAGEKEDYYDDITTNKVSVKEKARDLDDEFIDENEESKEYENKLVSGSIRTIRSPWKLNTYTDKFGDKGSSVMAKTLGILPMFPQVPNTNADVVYIAPAVNPSD